MAISSKLLDIKTDDNDTRVRQVSWAIFEVSWGKTKDRDTDEIVDLTRARMKMTRVCVYHVGQKYASDSAGIVGECLAVMAFECARYQVDFIVPFLLSPTPLAFRHPPPASSVDVSFH